MYVFVYVCMNACMNASVYASVYAAGYVFAWECLWMHVRFVSVRVSLVRVCMLYPLASF